MPNPYGNPNNSGGKLKRSGRKSAYAEQASARLLIDAFFNEYSRNEIKQRLAGGKYSLMDVLISKAFSGDVRVLLSFFDKLFPTRIINEQISAEENEYLWSKLNPETIEAIKELEDKDSKIVQQTL